MVRERFVVAFARQQQGINGCVRAEGVLPDSRKDEIARMGLGERVGDGSELFRDHGCGREREGEGGRGRDLYMSQRQLPVGTPQATRRNGFSWSFHFPSTKYRLGDDQAAPPVRQKVIGQSEGGGSRIPRIWGES